jgi:hypothetical protein
MSYTDTAPRKASSNPGPALWARTHKIVLGIAAYIAVVALITLAQVAADRLAGDTDAPFASSDSRAF